MTDPIFSDPRLAALYDVLEGDRPDLEAYAEIVNAFGARSVLDIGCGTGVFACLLAQRGISVTGVDPAAASLDIARGKPGASGVDWILGDATQLPPLSVDMAIMTGNVAQVFLSDQDWLQTLIGIHGALRPGGHFVFETRDPEKKAWTRWNREETYRKTVVEGVGGIETWCDVMKVEGDLVTFRWTHVFESDGATVVSDSTLRFRGRKDIESALVQAGYAVTDIRDAPDRPGLEFVFIAQRI